MKHVTINISDVVSSGSVSAAIATWCENDESTSCGRIAFRAYGVMDTDICVRRSIEDGAQYYIDEDDGRMIEALPIDIDSEDIDIDNLPDDVVSDGAGGYSRIDEWTDESVVCVVCPSIADAVENPVIAAEMAQSVIDFHPSESDIDEWTELIKKIKTASTAFDDINF